MAVKASSLALLHGAANLAGGLWPLLHLDSFEVIFGPKVDRWLVKTVSGLLIVNGAVQISSRAAHGLPTARFLGIGTAAVLAAIDLIYVPKGQISAMYLLDAALEIGWIVAWTTAELPRP